MTSPNKSAVIVPLRPELRDASRIPAEIAKRLTVIVGKIGIETWPASSRVLLVDWMAGNAPADWRAWRDFQQCETSAREHVTTGKHVRPMIEVDGNWVPAPATAKERESAAEDQRALDAAVKRASKLPRHSGGTMKLAPEFEARVIESIAEKAVAAGCQVVPAKLPPNVIALPWLVREPKRAKSGSRCGRGPDRAA